MPTFRVEARATAVVEQTFEVVAADADAALEVVREVGRDEEWRITALDAEDITADLIEEIDD